MFKNLWNSLLIVSILFSIGYAQTIKTPWRIINPDGEIDVRSLDRIIQDIYFRKADRIRATDRLDLSTAILTGWMTNPAISDLDMANFDIDGAQHITTESLQVNTTVYVGTKLRIGTTDFTYVLDIKENADTRIRLKSSASGQYAGLFLIGNNNQAGWTIRSGGDSTPDLEFFDDSDTQVVTFKDGGKVGIATNAPPNILSVASSGGGDGIALVTTNNQVQALVGLANSGGFLELYDSSGTKNVTLLPYNDSSFHHGLEIRGDHHYYGSIYSTDISSSLNTNNGLWTRITNFEHIGFERGVTGTVSGLEDGITVSTSGVYRIDIETQFNGVANTEYNISISTAGVATEIDDRIHIHRKTSSGNDVASAGDHAYVHLESGTKVSAWVTNLTGTNKAFIANDITFSLEKK